MIPLTEAVRGIYGAWRLIHFDRDGAQYFDSDPRRFLLSFWAPVLVFPGFVIMNLLVASLAAPHDNAGTAPSLLEFVIVQALVLAVAYTTFALVMFHVADALNRTEHCLAYLCAHNWSVVIQMAIVLPASALLAATGTDGSGWGPAVFFAALIGMWVYTMFIARAVLDITVAGAFMVTVIDFAITLVTDSIGSSLLAS